MAMGLIKENENNGNNEIYDRLNLYFWNHYL